MQWTIDTEEEDKEEFSNETNNLFNDKVRHEQHAAEQHTLEKGLKHLERKAKTQCQKKWDNCMTEHVLNQGHDARRKETGSNGTDAFNRKTS